MQNDLFGIKELIFFLTKVTFYTNSPNTQAHSNTITTTMASTLKQQDQEQPHRACTSHDTDVSSNVQIEPPTPSQVEDEYHALATQTATLDLENQGTDPVLSNKDADDTWSDEEAPSDGVDEDSQPQHSHATAAAPTDDVQEDQSRATEDVKNADAAITSEDANPEPSQDDETNTPRFQTYIKLHNDVSSTS